MEVKIVDFLNRQVEFSSQSHEGSHKFQNVNIPQENTPFNCLLIYEYFVIL